MNLNSTILFEVKEHVSCKEHWGEYSVLEVWKFLDKFAELHEPESVYNHMTYVTGVNRKLVLV